MTLLNRCQTTSSGHSCLVDHKGMYTQPSDTQQTWKKQKYAAIAKKNLIITQVIPQRHVLTSVDLCCLWIFKKMAAGYGIIMIPISPSKEFLQQLQSAPVIVYLSMKIIELK